MIIQRTRNGQNTPDYDMHTGAEDNAELAIFLRNYVGGIDSADRAEQAVDNYQDAEAAEAGNDAAWDRLIDVELTIETGYKQIDWLEFEDTHAYDLACAIQDGNDAETIRACLAILDERDAARWEVVA